MGLANQTLRVPASQNGWVRRLIPGGKADTAIFDQLPPRFVHVIAGARGPQWLKASMGAQKLGSFRAKTSMATLIEDDFRQTGQESLALGLGLQDVPQVAVCGVLNACNDVVGLAEIQDTI